MENENENVQPVSVEFFVGELAQVTQAQDRRYDSLSKRVEELEKKNHGPSDEIFDGRMIGLMVFLTVAPILLQITADLIKKWQSSE